MRALLGLCLIVLSVSSSAGTELQPFLTTDQNPFIQVYSLPPAAGARLTEAGAWRYALQLDLTSNSIAENGTDESVVIDGETYRTTLWIKYGLTERLEAGLIVPYVMQRRGVFDNFIEDWHDTFGLSNRKRTVFEDRQLNFSYSGDDASQQLSEPTEGLGDVRLTLGYPVYGNDQADRRIVLRAGLKLPSGDAARLTGSGGTDLALQLDATDAVALAGWNTALFWSAGVLRLGSGEVLEAIRRDYVALGTVAVARPLTEKVALKLQLDGHSSFYDSGLAGLGSSAVQLTVGGQIDLSRGSSLDLGLVENLFTDTTPDLVFHFALRSLL
jgi:hypothetical protein